MSGQSHENRPSKFENSMLYSIGKHLEADREREALQQQLKHLQQLMQKKRWELRRALDIHTTLLTDTDALKDGEQVAARLAQRHQNHWISPDLVKAIAPLTGNAAETERVLEPFRQRANTTGFFLMQYDQEMMLERLTSPSYVIAEASGRSADEDHPRHHAVAPAADCQMGLPEARADAEFVFELPEKNDHIIQAELVEKLKLHPWETAEVKDLATDPGMENGGLAGAARSAAFDHIRDVVNPQRGEFPIRNIAASIAQVTGVELPDGKTVRLIGDLDYRNGIFNTHSVHAHSVGRYPAVPVYNLLNRKVPVEVEGQQYFILVTWMMYFHDLLRKAETA